MATVSAYARIQGCLYWRCPACGRDQTRRFTPLSDGHLKCKYRNCHTTFHYSSTFTRLRPGSRHIPARDQMMVDEGVWCAGDPANKVLCASCGDIIFDRDRDRVDSTT